MATSSGHFSFDFIFAKFLFPAFPLDIKWCVPYVFVFFIESVQILFIHSFIFGYILYSRQDNDRVSTLLNVHVNCYNIMFFDSVWLLLYSANWNTETISSTSLRQHTQVIVGFLLIVCMFRWFLLLLTVKNIKIPLVSTHSSGQLLLLPYDVPLLLCTLHIPTPL